MAVKNINAIGSINFVAVLLSIPIILAGIWLTTKADNSCVKLLQWPIILLGIMILVVTLAGLVGGFWRVQWLLILYLISMLVMIILLGFLVVFIYMVTIGGSGHLPPSRAYLEYKLDDYSGWLRRRIQNPWHWDGIRTCLSSSTTCAELSQSYRMAQDFFNAHLSPLQSGCCKPPTDCGYTFVNPSYWISPINNAAGMDCLQWNNNQTELCYTCDSCKAGLLANLNREWRYANLILIVTFVALICVYIAGCWAFRRAKTESLFSQYNQGYT
ncbi:protein TORNADO 2-like [Impatiens glandulifera]|uniref:protein TORNADO 2-like n=1 Tax=Impatiens glandulifera TaxID=253017 RepID=UPI001FB0E1FB|nr:protein TORNADO 2-like [Impatiens glandulifera]